RRCAGPDRRSAYGRRGGVSRAFPRVAIGCRWPVCQSAVFGAGRRAACRGFHARAMQGAPPASYRFPLPGTAPTRTAQLGDATATGPAARVSVRAHVDIADASTWLVLLLLGDLAFIAIHGLWLALPGIEGRVYALDYDRGHAEFYQYTKALWIVALLAALTVRSRARGYLAGVGVFALLLVA